MILCKLIGYNPSTDEYSDPLTGNLSNLPDEAYKVVNGSVPFGYEDISSITSWWNSTLLDWGRRRANLKPLFYAKAGADLSQYATLTDEEKRIGAECFLIPYAFRMQIWSEDEDNQYWSVLLSKTQFTRKITIEAMRKAVGDRIRLGSLTLLQTQVFDKDTSNMISWLERSDARDFYQWLTNEVGSAYENDGFAQKSYFSQSLKDELMGIYSGNF